MFVVHVDRQRSLTGQVKRTLFIARTLKARGQRVALIAHPGSELAQRGRDAEIEVHELPMRGARLYASALRAARRLRGRGVDIIHCHGGRDQVLALGVARLAGIPHVIRTKHNHTPPRGRRSLLAYGACTRVVTVSEYVGGMLVAAGVSPERVAAIPSAIDVERFAPRPRDPALALSLGIEERDVVIGNVSSLHRRKGIDDVLRAFARLRKESGLGTRLKCLLVGKRAEAWRELARELGVADGVVFPGFRGDVPELLSLLDVFVLPSRHEALGTSALEAMAMERAVVVSDVEGLAEAVTPETGVRVPPGDVDALVREIHALLADPARARTLGAAARARVLAHFSDTSLAERTLALYEDVLGALGSAPGRLSPSGREEPAPAPRGSRAPAPPHGPPAPPAARGTWEAR